MGQREMRATCSAGTVAPPALISSMHGQLQTSQMAPHARTAFNIVYMGLNIGANVRDTPFTARWFREVEFVKDIKHILKLLGGCRPLRWSTAPLLASGGAPRGGLHRAPLGGGERPHPGRP